MDGHCRCCCGRREGSPSKAQGKGAGAPPFEGTSATGTASSASAVGAMGPAKPLGSSKGKSDKAIVVLERMGRGRILIPYSRQLSRKNVFYHAKQDEPITELLQT